MICKLFLKYDLDEDGFLARKELRILLKDGYDLMNKSQLDDFEFDEFIRKYDKNHDDKIDMRELKCLFSSFLEKNKQ